MKPYISYALCMTLGLGACATAVTDHGAGSSEIIVKVASNASPNESVSLAASQVQAEPDIVIIDVAERLEPVKASLKTDFVDLPGADTVEPPVKIKNAAKEAVLKTGFKQLEYGAHKPLVCKNPVPAKGKLKGRPNLQVMWENYLYPRPEGIWSEIGGYVEINGNLPEGQGRWTNACAIRLSHMLLKAGHRIPQRYGITSSAANKDQYIYRLSDMEDYLIEILGQPDHVMKGESTQWYNLPNVPGIVVIDFPGHNSFTGHTTVWNGAGTVDGSDTVGDKLLFWELPCFIPEDRISDADEDTPEILLGEAETSLDALP